MAKKSKRNASRRTAKAGRTKARNKTAAKRPAKKKAASRKPSVRKSKARKAAPRKQAGRSRAKPAHQSTAPRRAVATAPAPMTSNILAAVPIGPRPSAFPTPIAGGGGAPGEGDTGS